MSGINYDSLAIKPFCSQKAPESPKNYSRIVMACDLMDELIQRGEAKLIEQMRKSVIVKAHRFGKNGQDLSLGRVNLDDDIMAAMLTIKVQSRVKKIFQDSIEARQIIRNRNYEIRFVKVLQKQQNANQNGTDAYVYETLFKNPQYLEQNFLLSSIVRKAGDPLSYELFIAVEFEGIQQIPPQGVALPVEPALPAQAVVMPQQSSSQLLPAQNVQASQLLPAQNIAIASNITLIKVEVLGLRADGQALIARANPNGTFADLRANILKILRSQNADILNAFPSMRLQLNGQIVTDETVSLAQRGVTNNTRISAVHANNYENAAQAGMKVTVRFGTGRTHNITIPEDATLSDLRTALENNAQGYMSHHDSFCDTDHSSLILQEQEDLIPVSDVIVGGIVQIHVAGAN